MPPTRSTAPVRPRPPWSCWRVWTPRNWMRCSAPVWSCSGRKSHSTSPKAARCRGCSWAPLECWFPWIPRSLVRPTCRPSMRPPSRGVRASAQGCRRSPKRSRPYRHRWGRRDRRIYCSMGWWQRTTMDSRPGFRSSDGLWKRSASTRFRSRPPKPATPGTGCGWRRGPLSGCSRTSWSSYWPTVTCGLRAKQVPSPRSRPRFLSRRVHGSTPASLRSPPSWRTRLR